MALLAIVAIYAALFLYYVQANFIGQPYWDMLSIVTRYLQYLRDGNIWSYLWEPHVQHRQLWMRLLTALDAEMFSGVAYPFVLAAVACQATTAWLLFRVARRGVSGPPGLWMGSLAVMLTLTSVAAVDCALPMNGIYPQTAMFATAAFLLFDRGDVSPSGGHLWSLLGMLAATGAAFGNAAGLAVWPIFFWTAWQTDRKAWAIVVLFVAGPFGAVYLRGIPDLSFGDAASASAASADAASLARTFDYLVTYLGLPWTRSASLEAMGKGVGALLLLFTTACVLRAVSRRVTTRLDRLALALMTFGLATAVLAAIGRSGVDTDLRVPVRYSVFVGLLHVGMLFFIWPRLLERWPSRAARGRLYVVAIGIALLLTGQQIVAGQAALATTRSMRDVLMRFAAGEETEEMTKVVYVDLKQARRDLDAIHAAGLYLNTR